MSRRGIQQSPALGTAMGARRVTYPASYYAGPLGQNVPLPRRQGAFLIEDYGYVGGTWPDYQAGIMAREAFIGRSYDCIHVQYWGGGTTGGGVFGLDQAELDRNMEQWIHGRGQIPCVTWSPDYTIPQVNSGTADAIFTLYANRVKAYGYPIMLRMFWEFDNTSGFPWAVGGSGNIGANFITAWRRVVGLFQSAGCTNVGFWWCPLEGSPDRPGIVASYPGDAYVDWVGSDVYAGCYVGESDCYSAPATPGWQQFALNAAYPYSLIDSSNQYALWSPRKAFVYGEVGVGQPAADNSFPTYRGDWYRNVATTLRSQLPLCCGISFFDQDVSALEGPRNNWFVNAGPSADSYNGYKQMAGDPWLNTR